MNDSRRKFLTKSFLGGGSLILTNQALANTCTITPAQTEGPFYPIEDQLDTDNDLVFIKGSTSRALGEIVYIQGKILDQNCMPVENAMVEIWQANKFGKYNHPNDPNQAKDDKNFQYWGKTLSNKQGLYSFRTIIPGPYPVNASWSRPPHIHFKISLRGYEELTTQMYFNGHNLNLNDRILQSLSKIEKENVIVDFKRIGDKQVGQFDIALNKLI